ncbi:MAG: sigma-70 family RNA polymerase sigma factor [Bacteroidota bacterium]
MNLTTETIWNLQGPSVYLYILKRAKDTAVAEDVLQNTFVQVHEHLGSLKDTSKVKPWVFQIARNELAKYYRKSPIAISNTQSPDTEDPLVIDEFCCFERFLEELPKHYQKVIELVYLHGKTNEEAAKELDLSLANVKARIRRAKDKLRERFQECCNFSINKSGKLEGSADCAVCDSN